MRRYIRLAVITLTGDGFDDAPHGLQALSAACTCTALATDFRYIPLARPRSGADFAVGDSFAEADDHRLDSDSMLIMKSLINCY